MVVQPRRRQFTVDEYYRMAEAGVLGSDDRVELIEGEIIQMAAIGSRHASIVSRFNKLFTSRLGDRVLVRIQDPVRLNDLSEPEPDVAVLRPTEDFYAEGHPGPTDVHLIVEVADTTVAFDRDIKMPLYAQSGIPEYWLVDVEHRTLIVHRRPGLDRYKDISTLTSGGSIALLAFPEETFTVDGLLGPQG